MGFSDTIRTIAKQTQSETIKAQLFVLATQYEEQQNRVNNNWQMTFSSLENAHADALEAMRYDIEQDIGQREARERQMQEAIDDLRAEVEALKTRTVGENGDE